MAKLFDDKKREIFRYLDNCVKAQRWDNLDNETIHEKSERFKDKDPECKGLSNWYPVAIKPLPLHLARLICQRTNCWWNWKLRKRYMNGLIASVIIVLLTLILIGILTKMTMVGFVLGLLFHLKSLT